MSIVKNVFKTHMLIDTETTNYEDNCLKVGGKGWVSEGGKSMLRKEDAKKKFRGARGSYLMLSATRPTFVPPPKKNEFLYPPLLHPIMLICVDMC